jgi:hypothetical protein
MTFLRCVPEDMRAELSEMHSFFSSSQQLNAHAATLLALLVAHADKDGKFPAAVI